MFVDSNIKPAFSDYGILSNTVWLRKTRSSRDLPVFWTSCILSWRKNLLTSFRGTEKEILLSSFHQNFSLKRWWASISNLPSSIVLCASWTFMVLKRRLETHRLMINPFQVGSGNFGIPSFAWKKRFIVQNSSETNWRWWYWHRITVSRIRTGSAVFVSNCFGTESLEGKNPYLVIIVVGSVYTVSRISDRRDHRSTKTAIYGLCIDSVVLWVRWQRNQYLWWILKWSNGLPLWSSEVSSTSRLNSKSLWQCPIRFPSTVMLFPPWHYSPSKHRTCTWTRRCFLLIQV